jgi:murein L,D-transpeptidase YafK
MRVQTEDGAVGYVYYRDISNAWIRVSKRTQTLDLYHGARLAMRVPIDLGQNVFTDKERRGNLENPDHWRTPTGVFFIANKNARSQYYKALVLNYPNAEDAERGLQQRYISRSQYDAILKAETEIRMPPMNTPLGGWIEIHGDGTGARSNWTQGCIAVKNDQLDRIWQQVHIGTPVLVEP